MPIDISEFREPRFIRYETRYPISPDKKDRYLKFENYPRSYRGRDGGLPQPGYNPNHQSTTIEKINLESENITLKPR